MAHDVVRAFSGVWLPSHSWIERKQTGLKVMRSFLILS